MSVTYNDCDLSVIDNGEICSDESSKLKIFGHTFNEIKWRNVFFLIFLHVFAIYGYVHALLVEIKFFTAIFAITLSLFSGLGLSVGKRDAYTDNNLP